jgi:hypothetical protein
VRRRRAGEIQGPADLEMADASSQHPEEHHHQRGQAPPQKATPAAPPPPRRRRQAVLLALHYIHTENRGFPTPPAAEAADGGEGSTDPPTARWEEGGVAQTALLYCLVFYCLVCIYISNFDKLNTTFMEQKGIIFFRGGARLLSFLQP